MNKNDIPFDGFKNVIEMLKTADSTFREKIIRNIAARDPVLAKRLLEATKQAMQMEKIDGPVRSSTRNYAAKNYKNY